MNTVHAFDNGHNLLLFNCVSCPTDCLHAGPSGQAAKVRVVFDHSNTRIVGSNPAQGTDICPLFSMLCCSV
jgi:hypothetical protein